jgi:hypothetical protein
MAYTAPRIVMSGSILHLTQGQLKGPMGVIEFSGPSPGQTDMYNTQPAYEADE